MESVEADQAVSDVCPVYTSNSLSDFDLDTIQGCTNARMFQSATPIGEYEIDTSLYADFITFLGIAQELKIDFLPITWMPEMFVDGGATALIRESLANHDVDWAFKCLRPPQNKKSASLRPLIAELSTLGCPFIRRHPNIVTIEGICWDFSRPREVWPVIVLRKSRSGDLAKFMKNVNGKKLSLYDRLRLCSDIAEAIRAMHSISIIHGDIKPENILIFEDGANNIVPKLIDFGYSTLFAREQSVPIAMPGSWPWYAPEWHHKFKAKDITMAKKMDAYSFGLLCVWILFYNTVDKKGQSFYEEVEEMPILIDSHLANASLPQQTKDRLQTLFSLTLAKNSASRGFDFDYFLRLFVPERTTKKDDLLALPYTMQPHFEIALSLQQFYLTDYRLRVHVAVCLEKICEQAPFTPELHHPSFQLALCYALGFGVAKNDVQSELFLAQSSNPAQHLKHVINDIKTEIIGTYSFEENSLFSQLDGQDQVIWIHYGGQYRAGDKSNESELIFRREIADIRHTLGEEHYLLSILITRLKVMLQRQERYAELEALLHEEVETNKTRLGKKDSETLGSIIELTDTIFKQGRLKEAEDLQMDVLETAKEAYGNEHSYTLDSMSKLASTILEQARWEEVEKLQVQVFEVRKRIFGLEDKKTIRSMEDLAWTYKLQGRIEEATVLWMQTTDMMRRVYGEEHPLTLSSLSNLIDTHKAQQCWEEAETIAMQVMKARQRTLGQEHPETLISIGKLATVYEAQDQWTKAENYMREALKASILSLGEEHSDTLILIVTLASNLKNQKRWEEAKQLQNQAIDKRKQILGSDHPTTLDAISGLASIFFEQDCWREALEIERCVMETRNKTLGQAHSDTLHSMNNVAAIYIMLEEWDFGEELIKKTLVLTMKQSGFILPSTLPNLENLDLAWEGKGHHDAEFLHECILPFKNKLGENHPQLVSAIEELEAWENIESPPERVHHLSES